jgi:aromatic ring-opening dioxygenase catalytic subunit (LigB family)
VSTAERHSLLFDYGGFPPESYRYTYSPPGAPAIAANIKDLLGKAGIPCDTDSSRGIDHGVFVPMMLLYPDASVPVVPISLHASLGADVHLRIGEALAPLRDEGVLILGSGASFHNFDYFFASSPQKKADGKRHSKVWGDYLRESLTTPALSTDERKTRLVNWSSMCPSARAAQPLGGDEHLLPLHVVAGAARCSKGAEMSTVSPILFDLDIPSFEWRD